MTDIKVSYIDHMGDDLRVTNAARVSFLSESKEFTEKDARLVQRLADDDHMSPFEHNILTIMIECPLYIRSQIHRHRTASFSEISRRYSSVNIEFYTPSEYNLRRQSKINKQASEGQIGREKALNLISMIDKHHRQSLDLYNQLLNEGVCREQARGVLPQDLMTKFYATANLRNWVHFIELREAHDAQAEVQVIARAIKEIILEKFPVSGKALLV